MSFDRNVEIRLRTTGLFGMDLQILVRTTGMSNVFPLRTSGISL